MGSVRGAAALLCGLLVLATTRAAKADGKSCGAAAENGQRARAAGQFRTAHRELLECSADDCPALVRRDCAQWATSLAESMPTIVVDARDAGGRDIGDVTVTIDGELVARSLDGKAIPIDPGPHTLVFAHRGAPSVTEKVIIKEAARGRTFVVKFGAAPASEAPASDAVPAHEPTSREHGWAPWVVVAAGATATVAGIIMLVAAPEFPKDCDKSSETCKPLPGEASTSPTFKTRQDKAGSSVLLTLGGTVTVLAGAAILTGGLLWHFLEPTGPVKSGTRPKLVPWGTAESGGIAAIGAF